MSARATRTVTVTLSAAEVEALEAQVAAGRFDSLDAAIDFALWNQRELDEAPPQDEAALERWLREEVVPRIEERDPRTFKTAEHVRKELRLSHRARRASPST